MVEDGTLRETQPLLEGQAVQSNGQYTASDPEDHHVESKQAQIWRSEDNLKVAAAIFSFFATGMSMTAIGVS